MSATCHEIRALRAQARLVFGCAALLLLACGGGRPESPESLAREVFDAIKRGDQAGFLAKQAQESDYLRTCPTITPQELADARIELAEARSEAMLAYDACRQAVNFEGAEITNITRNPTEGEIVTMRFHGCASTLNFPQLRVIFTRNGVRGNIYLQNVIDMDGRWVHRNGVRLCEQSVPQ